MLNDRDRHLLKDLERQLRAGGPRLGTPVQGPQATPPDPPRPASRDCSGPAGASRRPRSLAGHPRGSGDLRQRRHSCRAHQLPPVALLGQPEEWRYFATGLTEIGSSTDQPISPSTTVTTAPGNPSNQQQFLGEETMNKLYNPTQTHLHRRAGRPTDFGEPSTDISGRLDHSSQSTSTSGSIRPSQDHSTPRSEKARSTAGVVVTHLLAVLVVVMVITSMLGFTVFDRQGGNSQWQS